MKTTRAYCLSLSVLAFFLVVGCSERDQPDADNGSTSRPVVVSANYPLHFFTESIGGELIDPRFLVPTDVDPAHWEPTVDDITELQQSDLILLNGAGYEQWRSKISLPESRLVNTTAGLDDRLIHEQSGTTHQHGPGGEHAHGETAFTTWLDSSLAIEQSLMVARALGQLLPEQAAILERNLQHLTNQLSAIDRDLQAWGESVDGEPLIASHPVYQYFGRRYGLNLVNVHWEPHVVPDEASWDELEQILQRHPAQIMIWEDVPAKQSIDRLQRMGVTSVVFNPCSNVPEEGDYMDLMKKQVAQLSQ